MTVWATIRRSRIGAALPLFFVLLVPASVQGADEPAKPNKPTDWRTKAELAEKAGDWEAAFTAYCHVFVAERNAPDIREKLNLALRRAQQIRRHRDQGFQQFVTGMSMTEAMRLFVEVVTKVPVLYVERERATPQILWDHGIEELARALDSPVFRQAFLTAVPAEKIELFRASLRTTWAKQPIATAEDARKALLRVIQAGNDALGIRVRSGVFILEVVCGSCAGLDEYTVFLNPAQFTPDPSLATPDLTAHGVYLGLAQGNLTVAGVAPGSWAAHSLNPRLNKGDRIIRINGKLMDSATLATAGDALRHPLDGFHEIEIAAAGDNPGFLARLPVVVPTVYGTALVNAAAGIGYLRIGSISPNTPRELDEAIFALKARGVRSLVIDLRGNMGGSFMGGVETAKRLLPSGLIVTTQGQLSQVDNQPFSSDSGMSAHDIPVVVLVDSETASAAEVLAIALKDHGRATLVGMPTFGKGAIQYPVRLDSLDEKDPHGKPKTTKTGGVRLTIAKLLSPRGAPINGVGVTPDILEAHPDQQFKRGVEEAGRFIPSMTRPMPVPMMIPTMSGLSANP
jgi:carboxyl-terminal processing protease